ncbi:hypothetical protein ABXJ56_15685 [Microbacterium chocolatum]|uniref:hypothetical protein n=1 Tax=Microbacterium aurantiacum TaxID=162393 RepID=UPI00338D5308
MPIMTEAQEAGWYALMDLYKACPQGWALVGGQLVHLWCAERQTFVARPTDDADAVLDVREHPDIHYRVTAVLQGMGFTAETTSEGVQHRWVKGKAVIDLLIPRHLGEVASNKPGAGGGRTIATPGAQKVLNRTEVVHVQVGYRVGGIPRPTLLGAIIGKASAYTVALDGNRDRHLGDLVVLASMLQPKDVRTDLMDGLELTRVANAVGHARNKPATWAYVPGGADALDRLAAVVNRQRRSRELGKLPAEQ